MSDQRGEVLLPIARAAIARVLDLSHTANESAPWLAEQGACFVTLTQFGELRGCIGSLQAHRSLLDDVKSNAVSAALHDPRFTPLSVEELDITTVEVSLLSKSQEMQVRDEADALAQLRPGVDGIIFEYRSPDTLLAETADCGRGSLAAIPAPKGFAPPSRGRCYRSTFLPQVWESLAQPRDFLAMLRRKAGLPDDFWAEGVKLSRYSVTKWSEPERHFAGELKEHQHG